MMQAVLTAPGTIEILLNKGLIKTENLITNRFPFREYSEAYKFIDEQGDRTLKVMIDL